MNPNPPQPQPQSFAEKLRSRRAEIMAPPKDMSEAQQGDIKRAKDLQLELVAIEQKIAGTDRLPRRPKGLREEARAVLEEEKKQKQQEFNEVMSRVSFL